MKPAPEREFVLSTKLRGRWPWECESFGTLELAVRSAAKTAAYFEVEEFAIWCQNGGQEDKFVPPSVVRDVCESLDLDESGLLAAKYAAAPPVPSSWEIEYLGTPPRRPSPPALVRNAYFDYDTAPSPTPARAHVPFFEYDAPLPHHWPKPIQ